MKILIRTMLLVCLFFGSLAGAAQLSELIISSGSHSGKKLIDVVEDYTIPGQSRKVKVHIPVKAIHDAFDFFDRYVGTTRSYSYVGINPDVAKPGLQYLGGVSSGVSATIGNQRFMVIFDLNLHSSLKRLHVIDLENGKIISYEAAHGLESDCGSKKPGFACKFISDIESDASPLGFFQTGQIVNGEEHGRVLTMNGLEKSSSGFSGNDIPSTIVIHSARYVYPGHAGRSHGCPAVSEANIGWIRDNLKDGALFYFYHASLGYSGRDPVVSGIQTKATAKPVVPSSESDSDSQPDDEEN